MSIISKLAGLRRSSELYAAARDIEGEIAEVEERLRKARAELGAAPFEAGADIGAIRNAVHAAEDELLVLQSALAEGRTRGEQAVLREADEAIVRKMGEAAADRERLREAWAEFDRYLTALSEVASRVSTLTDAVRLANQVAGQAGRGDLRVQFPDGPTSLGALNYLLKNLRDMSKACNAGFQ